MKTTIAIIIKFIVTAAAAWVSIALFGTVSLRTVLLIAAAGTLLNYLVGDLLLLPRIGNMVSAIIDGILGGAAAWMILALMPVTYYYMTSVYIFALIVAVAEVFFHMYLLRAHVVVVKRTDKDFYKKQKLNYSMETGNELYPYSSRTSNESSGREGTLNSGYNKSVNLQDNADGNVRNDKK